MAQSDAAEDAPQKKSKLPILIGLVLLLLCGGGGFFATFKALVPGLVKHAPAEPVAALPEQPKTAFVPLESLVVSLGAQAERHLRFSAQLEMPLASAPKVEELKPRVMDVLNSYLRAVDLKDIADPTAMTRLRAQMLRRVQIVTGPGLVSDLLIMEFVVN